MLFEAYVRGESLVPISLGGLGPELTTLHPDDDNSIKVDCLPSGPHHRGGAEDT